MGRLPQRQRQETTPLLESAAVIVRALDSVAPSRSSLLFFLTEADQTFQQTHPEYEAAKHRYAIFKRPGSVRNGPNISPQQAAADTDNIRKFMDGCRALIEAIFWCLARIGGRGGPIRRRGILLMRKVGHVTGPGVVVRLGEDLRAQLIVPKKNFALEEAKQSLYVGRDRGGVSAASLLLADVSDAGISGRFHAADSIYLMLGPKLKQKATKDDLALALALIVASFPKSTKTEERILEKCIEYGKTPSSSKTPGNGVGCAILVAEAVTKMRSSGSLFCDSVAESCQKNLKASSSTCQRKIWAVAFVRSILTSILATRDIPSENSTNATRKQRKVPQNENFIAEEVDTSIFETALNRILRVPDVRNGQPGALWILATVLRMWFLALPEMPDKTILKAVEILGNSFLTFRAFKVAEKAVRIGILGLVSFSSTPCIINALIPYHSAKNLGATLSLYLTARIINSNTFDPYKTLGDVNIRTDALISACYSSLSANLACVRAAAVEVISALANTREELRSQLLLSVLQNLRIADLQLCTKATTEGSPGDIAEPEASLLGNVSALAILIEECAPYPGLPSDLIMQTLTDAMTLFRNHPLATPIANAENVRWLRRLAGWTFLGALTKNVGLEWFTKDRENEILALFREELGHCFSSGDSSISDGTEEYAAVQSASRSEALKTLVAFSKRYRSEKLDATCSTMIGCAAARLGLAEAQLASLCSGEKELAVALDTSGVGGIADISSYTRSSEVQTFEASLAFMESSSCLDGISSLPPYAVVADMCHHLACTMIIGAQSSMYQVLDDLIGIQNSRYTLMGNGEPPKQKGRNFVQDHLTYMFSSSYVKHAGLKSIMSSLQVIGAIIAADTASWSSRLSYIATASVDGHFSPFLSSALALSILQKLSVSDISKNALIRESLKKLLKNGLRGISKYAVLSDDDLHDAEDLRKIGESFVGQSWNEYMKFFPLYMTDSEGLLGSDWQSIVCAICCAVGYKELGMKGGEEVWLAICGDILQLFESTNKSDGNAPLYANAIFSLGSLQSVIPRESAGQEAEEVSRVTVNIVRTFITALRDSDALMRMAGSYAVNQVQLFRESDPELFLTSLMGSLALESGYGNQESCSRVSENHFLVSESFIRCWNGVTQNDDNSFATFASHGCGSTLRAITAAASCIVSRLVESNLAITWSAKAAAYDIALEAVQWDASTFPEIVESGLQCLTNTWALSVSRCDSRTPLSLDEFLRPRLISSSVDLKAILLLILSNRESRPSSTALRKALVTTLSVLVNHCGPRVVLATFPSLPHHLLWIIKTGVYKASELLINLAGEKAPDRLQQRLIFKNWLEFSTGAISLKTETQTEAEAPPESSLELHEDDESHKYGKTDHYSCWTVVRTLHESLKILVKMDHELVDALLPHLDFFMDLILHVRCIFSLSLLKSLISLASCSSLTPCTEKIVSSLRIYMKVPIPFVTELCADVIIMYLSKCTKCEERCVASKSTLPVSILDSLIGENLIEICPRHKLDTFAESTEAFTTLCIVRKLLTLTRLHIQCECPVSFYWKGVLRFLISCQADFSLLLEPPRSIRSSNDVWAKVSGVSVRTLLDQLKLSIVEVSLGCTYILSGSLLTDYKDIDTICWLDGSSLGACACATSWTDIVTLGYPILTWAALEKGECDLWMEVGNLTGLVAEIQLKLGPQAVRELIMAIYSASCDVALSLCKAMVTDSHSGLDELKDAMFYVALCKWCSLDIPVQLVDNLAVVTDCIYIVSQVGYQSEAAEMIVSLLQAAKAMPCGVVKVLESARISSEIVNVLTKPISKKETASSHAHLLELLCSFAVRDAHIQSNGKDNVGDDDAWAAVQILLNVYCELDKRSKQSLLMLIVVSLFHWIDHDNKRPLINGILMKIAESDENAFQKSVSHLADAIRDSIHAIFRENNRTLAL